MNYKLTRELKDAGFTNWNQELQPTLSELIESCGEGFISLSRIDFIDSEKLQTDKKVVKYYRFNASGGKVRELTYRNKTYEHVKLGKTPEEAVARLWLALNKNGRIQGHNSNSKDIQTKEKD